MPPSEQFLLDRVPPHSLEAEKAILGSVLLVPELIDEISLTGLASHDFHSAANGMIWDGIQTLSNRDQPLDVTLLAEELKTRRNWSEIPGGNTYLLDLLDSVDSPHTAPDCARIVRGKAALRAAIHAQTMGLRDCWDPAADPQETLKACCERLFQVAVDGHADNTVNITECLRDLLPAIEARKPGAAPAGGVKTGFAGIDKLIGGLGPGRLYVVAAKSGEGKTAWALNVAERVAMQGKGVLYVSLEMDKRELAERLVICLAQVDGLRLRDGFGTAEDLQKLRQAQRGFTGMPLYIDDWVGSVEDVVAQARVYQRKHGLGLVVCDYLQLVQPTDPKASRQEQVAHVSRSLKQFARSAKIPVLCLAQLNRDVEKDAAKRPRRAFLRESGAIDQDADVVAFLWNKDNPDHAWRKGEQPIEFLVDKQRQGPTGSTTLLWWAREQRFEDRPLATAEEQQEMFDE